MPHQKEIETDGDPRTLYEDVSAHERTGFFVSDALAEDQVPEETRVEMANPSF
ncbi:hypothetical protein [Paenibacillus methanolicus]|uniref:Uncharacterized protein n=1 Tax=Paenibacillus methanolicus TaxID=582686 RepID=A0A5S5C7K9_9BACL|nr:hypothetical protein [Paenibacillus methanolicus]TYP73973.1 hypothetical protein BCM02_106253 [Paenibacillus methanolicus]